MAGRTGAGVIVFATCVGPAGRYTQVALPHLERLRAGGGVEVWTDADPASIAACYNRLLDRAARVDGLEALVLLHDDLEVRDPDALAKIRAEVAAPRAGVSGVIGGRGMTGMAWWVGEGTLGSTSDRYGLPVGTLGPGVHEVDAVDGMLLVVAPEAVRRCRLAPAPGFHGYDAELCFAARAAGLLVRTMLLDVHHRCQPPIPDQAAFDRAHAAFVARWFPPCPGCGRVVKVCSPTGRTCPTCGHVAATPA